MAASDTSLANSALTKLGEPLINSIDDRGKIPSLCKTRLPPIRDRVLREHTWNFAKHRVMLGADQETPVFGFDFQYTMPADYIKLIAVIDDNRLGWRVEGLKIVTDIGAPLKIEYIRRITDPNAWDVMFPEAVAYALAADIAEAVTGSNTKVNDLLAASIRMASAAKAPDGQEPSNRPVLASGWEDSRFGGPTAPVRGVGEGTPL